MPLTQLRGVCDVLVNIEGLYVLENMNGLRGPPGFEMSQEELKEFTKAIQGSPLALMREQIAKMK